MTVSDGGAGDLSRVDKLRRALSLLEESLQLIDEAKDYPDIGARISAVIDSVQSVAGNPDEASFRTKFSA